MRNPGLFSVSKISERLKGQMISDSGISKLIDELDSHFKAWHYVPHSVVPGPI